MKLFSFQFVELELVHEVVLIVAVFPDRNTWLFLGFDVGSMFNVYFWLLVVGAGEVAEVDLVLYWVDEFRWALPGGVVGDDMGVGGWGEGGEYLSYFLLFEEDGVDFIF